ncbi:MAG: hypothetical protein HY814_04610 [Candidatus Riflebacteria bacterium]|nr:hypothetical protein [Candidatus Riflebacteria bacterium]
MARSPRGKGEHELTEVIHFRVEPAVIARLDELGERYPMFSRNALSRVALRAGIVALEANPALLLEPAIRPEAETPKSPTK